MSNDDARETEAAHLDAAIDRAVRELMDVDPRGDLRARVLDAIERPRRRFSWTWMLAPIGAAAIVVLAILLMRPATPTEVPRTATDIVLPAPQTPAHAAPQVARGEEPRTPPRARVVVPRERQARAAAAVQDDTIFSSARPEGFAVVDALAPPPPLRMAIIADPGASTPPTLDIAPLEVAPLELNALTETPRARQE